MIQTTMGRLHTFGPHISPDGTFKYLPGLSKWNLLHHTGSITGVHTCVYDNTYPPITQVHFEVFKSKSSKYQVVTNVFFSLDAVEEIPDSEMTYKAFGIDDTFPYFSHSFMIKKIWLNPLHTLKQTLKQFPLRFISKISILTQVIIFKTSLPI
ncbi:hypothetical protein M7I_2663 [Glarea lozoyensis 74030]|uniref:Uncharacterized protein n=1 Tax=Glarea lozoyensis (strain ATCC 74030 / MF5533) TaxID=1104152 RepID=H0EJD7_GLAL7|nr:hypothetical protein M7I_2663 [Glarea lozoyensis 74030]